MNTEEFGAFISQEREKAGKTAQIGSRKKGQENGRKAEHPNVNPKLLEMAGNYARLPEAAEILKMSESAVVDVAKEAGAYFRIRSMSYCRIDLVLDYFERVREEMSKEYLY